MNSRSIFNSLQETLNMLEKRAADGMDSTMPDDPSGNGFQEPVTGDQYEEYDEEYRKLSPMDPDAGILGDASLTADNQQENSLSDFNISIAGEGESGQDYCKEYKDDPQGTSMPAEAGEEKYAEYVNYSFEENVAGFNKAAGYLLREMRSSLLGIPKTASLRDIPGEVFEKLGNCSNAELQKTIYDVDSAVKSVQDGIAMEKYAMRSISAQDYNNLQNLPLQQLNTLVIKTAEALDEIASTEDDIEAQPTEEELAALEELPPEDIEALAQLDDSELAELIDEVAAMEGDAALESEPEIAEEAAAIDALPEETVDQLAAMPEEKLASYIMKLSEDIAAADPTNAVSDAEISAALEEVPTEVLDNMEQMSPEELAAVIQDVDTAATDPVALDEAGESLGAMDLPTEDIGDTGISEAELADALAEVPPETLEALDAMSPAEIDNLIEEIDATAGDEGKLEEAAAACDAGDPAACAALAGGDATADTSDVSPEEAVNELSSAMTEQGITPEELATLGKEGSAKRLSLYKAAKQVKDLRDSGRYLYTYPKNAKMAAVRAQMNAFLREVTRQ